METETFKSQNFTSNKFDNTENFSGKKLKKIYELYEAGKIADVISTIESDSRLLSVSHSHLLLGNCYLRNSDRQKALMHWKKAIEISPLEHSAYINIGNELYRDGNLSEAIYNWQLACSIVPENPTVNLNLANAYNTLNNRIKATKFFEKYLKYEKNLHCSEYLKVKQVFTNLTAKVDFYSKKVEEYKLQRDIKTIAALYLKMVSTYANLPSIYANIAEILYFDKNYEKALEFYLLVYLYYPHTPQMVIDIANLYYLLGHRSYAYVYYKRAIDLVPEGTSFHNKIKSKLSELSDVLNNPDIIEEHLQRAKDAEKINAYEESLDEYENYLILSESENPDIQQIIDKYKIFANPEPFVINILYQQISDLMNRKKLNECIDVCDRIMALGENRSKEVMYAMKCKTECRRILIAREQFGV